jgi:hypothetical protein
LLKLYFKMCFMLFRYMIFILEILIPKLDDNFFDDGLFG